MAQEDHLPPRPSGRKLLDGLPGPGLDGIGSRVIVEDDLTADGFRNRRDFRDTDLRAQIDWPRHPDLMGQLGHLVVVLPPAGTAVSRAGFQYEIVFSLLDDLVVASQVRRPAPLP